jgi:hypothetical protein
MEFLSRLPQDDPFRLLEEITFWLKALRDAYGLGTAARTGSSGPLRRHRVPASRKLAEYFIMLGGRYENHQARRAWNTSSQFAHELGATYRFLVEQYRKGAHGFELLKPMLPLITARAMRALESELKWSLLRRTQLDEALWAAAGRVVRLCGRQRLRRRQHDALP